MGILNRTPDSFSDGGHFSGLDQAVNHARTMIADGVDIIDIGGESTRPGAAAVAVEEELDRVIPVIEALRSESAIPISIDTRKARVAHEALRHGANIVNDISAGLGDPEMLDVVSTYHVPFVMMHMQGTPETMQIQPEYTNASEEISSFFAERLEHCSSLGIEKVIIDPGIGFGKRLRDNLDIMRHLDAFRKFGVPVLLGASRKSFIGTITGKEPDERLGGSIACALYAALHGVSIVRVHDVAHTRNALQVLEAITNIKEDADAL